MIDDEPFSLEEHLANCTQSTPRSYEPLTLERLRAITQLIENDCMFSLGENPSLYRTSALTPDRHIDAFRMLTTSIEADYVPADQWFISPRTYETIRYIGQFRTPLRKLRKCQLRRIAARKRAWRKHRARTRVNRSVSL